MCTIPPAYGSACRSNLKHLQACHRKCRRDNLHQLLTAALTTHIYQHRRGCVYMLFNENDPCYTLLQEMSSWQLLTFHLHSESHTDMHMFNKTRKVARHLKICHTDMASQCRQLLFVRRGKGRLSAKENWVWPSAPRHWGVPVLVF